MEWEVIRNGYRIQSGSVEELNLEPGDSAEINIPLNKELMASAGEYFLNLSFRTKNELPYAAKGFEIAKEQILLKKGESYTHITP
jgi:beta-galactosidase